MPFMRLRKFPFIASLSSTLSSHHFLQNIYRIQLLLTTSTSNPQPKLPASPVWISTIASTPTRSPLPPLPPRDHSQYGFKAPSYNDPWGPPTYSHSPAHSTPAPPAAWLLRSLTERPSSPTPHAPSTWKSPFRCHMIHSSLHRGLGSNVISERPSL